MTEKEPDILLTQQCLICKVYFDNYTSATVHLALKHSHELKSAFSKNTAIHSNSNTKKTDDGGGHTSLIEPREFRRLFISLDRISTKNSPSLVLSPPDEKREKPSPSKTSTHNKPKGRRRSSICLLPEGRVELKLDTLKASEIETLLSDLYSQPSKKPSGTPINFGSSIINPKSPASADTNQDDVDTSLPSRKSRRVPKLRLPSCRSYGDLNSEDEYVPDKISSENSESESFSSEEDSDYDMEIKKANVSSSSMKNKNAKKKQRDGQPSSHIICIRCRLCKAEFSDSNVYVVHMEENHLSKEIGRYSCPYCQKTYFPVKPFNDHLRRHDRSEEKRKGEGHKVRGGQSTMSAEELTCKYCSKLFPNISSLTIHVQSHEKRINQNPALRPYECPICYHRFTEKHHVQRHMSIHLQNNPFTCKFPGCSKKFNGEHNLRRHVLLHTSREEFKCPHCPAMYAREDKIAPHIKRYHSPDSKETFKPRKRSIQVKPIKAAGRLSRDQLERLADDFILSAMKERQAETQEKEGNIKEDYDADDQSETESIHLADHIIKDEQEDIHLKEERLSPIKNSENKKNDDDLNKKSDKELSTETPTNFELNKSLRFNFQEDPVMRKLLAEKPDEMIKIFPPFQNNRSGTFGNFACTKCGWSGARRFHLQRHMENWHKEILPRLDDPEGKESLEGHGDNKAISVLCGMCGYRAKTGDELKLHMTAEHVGDKKYFCSYCGIRFKDKGKKEEHEMRVHLTEKKFRCPECPRKFSSYSSISAHRRRCHPTPGTIFKCDVCDKVVGSGLSLRKHKKLHTDQRELSTCKICSQICAGIHSLKRHIQYVHLGVPNPYNRKKKRFQEIATADTAETGAVALNKDTNPSASVQPQESTESDNLLLGL